MGDKDKIIKELEHRVSGLEECLIHILENFDANPSMIGIYHRDYIKKCEICSRLMPYCGEMMSPANKRFCKLCSKKEAVTLLYD